MVYEPRLGIGIPIQVLDLNSRGDSSFSERELVLEEIYNILRDYLERDLVELEVLGDREFIGEEWEEYIGKRDSIKVEMLFYVMAICYYISEVVGHALEQKRQ